MGWNWLNQTWQFIDALAKLVSWNCFLVEVKLEVNTIGLDFDWIYGSFGFFPARNVLNQVLALLIAEYFKSCTFWEAAFLFENEHKVAFVFDLVVEVYRTGELGKFNVNFGFIQVFNDLVYLTGNVLEYFLFLAVFLHLKREEMQQLVDELRLLVLFVVFNPVLVVGLPLNRLVAEFVPVLNAALKLALHRPLDDSDNA